MRLLLVRHAEAIAESGALDDAARWLTKTGRAQARELGEALRDMSFMPTRMLVSPRVRTVQTGELVAQALGFRGTVEALPALSYTVPAEQAARALSAYADDELLAAFGHMPTIAEIASRLTGGAHQAGFALAQAVMIEDGRVVWTVAPR